MNKAEQGDIAAAGDPVGRRANWSEKDINGEGDERAGWMK